MQSAKPPSPGKPPGDGGNIKPTERKEKTLDFRVKTLAEIRAEKQKRSEFDKRSEFKENTELSEGTHFSVPQTLWLCHWKVVQLMK